MLETVLVVHLAVLKCFSVPVVVMIARKNACKHFFFGIAVVGVVGEELCFGLGESSVGNTVGNGVLVAY